MLKKYTNRRLYDTAAHRYVTLPEVRQRLLLGERVIHASTQEDLTDALLMSVIMADVRSGGGPAYKPLTQLILASTGRPTTEQLRQFILSYQPQQTPEKVP